MRPPEAMTETTRSWFSPSFPGLGWAVGWTILVLVLGLVKFFFVKLYHRFEKAAYGNISPIQ
jgi:hypothetical protein